MQVTEGCLVVSRRKEGTILEDTARYLLAASAFGRGMAAYG